MQISLLHEESNKSKRLSLETLKIKKHSISDSYSLVNDFIPMSTIIDKIYK